MQTTTSLLTCQKDLFLLPDNIHYLNCAFMSPLAKRVEEAGIKGIQMKRVPANVKPTDFFEPLEEIRKLFAQLIHLQEPQRVAIIPSVSYGMGIVAKNIKLERNDNIVLTSEQFPSNVYPWRNLALEAGAHIKTISPPDTSIDRELVWNQHILDAIDGHTRLVTLGHIHWADGTLFDLAAIRKKTKEVGALLIIDGTQSVGALPFDVQVFQPDALICGGYKSLMGPYSIGLGYFGEAFDHGTPLEENWKNRLKSENFAGLVDYEDHYKPLALKYDVGESSNFILIPMLKESLTLINQWGAERVQNYCKDISSSTLQHLREAGFYIADAKYRSHHLFGIRIPQQTDIIALKRELESQKVYVSIRGDAIRVSPHVYNQHSDLAKLRTCLEHIF